MIRPFLTLLFSLLTLTGVGLIVCGLRLKPAPVREASKGVEDIVLGFSVPCQGGQEVFELEKSSEGMEIDEKKHFDPGKHQPERIESRKAPEDPERRDDMP